MPPFLPLFHPLILLHYHSLQDYPKNTFFIQHSVPSGFPDALYASLGVRRYESYIAAGEPTPYVSAAVFTHQRMRASIFKQAIEDYNERRAMEEEALTLRAQEGEGTEVLTLSRRDGQTLKNNEFYQRIQEAKKRGDPTYHLWPSNPEETRKRNLNKRLHIDMVRPFHVTHAIIADGGHDASAHLLMNRDEADGLVAEEVVEEEEEEEEEGEEIEEEEFTKKKRRRRKIWGRRNRKMSMEIETETPPPSGGEDMDNNNHHHHPHTVTGWRDEEVAMVLANMVNVSNNNNKRMRRNSTEEEEEEGEDEAMVRHAKIQRADPTLEPSLYQALIAEKDARLAEREALYAKALEAEHAKHSEVLEAKNETIRLLLGVLLHGQRAAAATFDFPSA